MLNAETSKEVINWAVNNYIWYSIISLLISFLAFGLLYKEASDEEKNEREFKEKQKQGLIDRYSWYSGTPKGYDWFLLALSGIFFLNSIFLFTQWYKAKYYPNKYLYEYKISQFDRYTKYKYKRSQ